MRKMNLAHRTRPLRFRAMERIDAPWVAGVRRGRTKDNEERYEDELSPKIIVDIS